MQIYCMPDFGMQYLAQTIDIIGRINAGQIEAIA